jgi:predicted transcriptional regulator
VQPPKLLNVGIFRPNGISTRAGTAQHGYSRITDEEMKAIIKNAVEQLYALFVLKIEKPDEYERKIQFGECPSKIFRTGLQP